MRIPSIVTLSVVFALGFVAALAGVSFGYSHIETSISTVITVVSLTLLLAVGIGFALLAFAGRLFRKLLGTSQTQLDAIVSPIGAGLRAWEQGNRQEAISGWEQAARILVARFAWIFLQRGVIGVVLALFGAYLGVLGSALLQSQNQILTSQNNLMAADQIRFRLERVDAAYDTLGKIMQTVVPVPSGRSENNGLLAVKAAEDPSETTTETSCTETAPCPDGTVGAVVQRVFNQPPPVSVGPDRLNDLHSPGLHRMILLGNWVGNHAKRNADLKRDTKALVEPESYAAELTRAARLCGFADDSINSVVADLQLVRRLENSAFFWGGRGAPDAVIYTIYDAQRFADFTTDLLALHMRRGGKYDEAYKVSEVTNQLVSTYASLNSAIASYLMQCTERQHQFERQLDNLIQVPKSS